eukprot:363422-Chlamydomonas_euryale.AAC.8
MGAPPTPPPPRPAAFFPLEALLCLYGSTANAADATTGPRLFAGKRRCSVCMRAPPPLPRPQPPPPLFCWQEALLCLYKSTTTAAAATAAPALLLFAGRKRCSVCTRAPQVQSLQS